MDPHAAIIYEDRTTNGIYKSIVKQLTKCEEGTLLANSEIGRHFKRSESARRGFYSYDDIVSRKEWSANAFGEIASAAEGTQNTAKGNYYPGVLGDRPLTDTQASVKDTYVLRIPTGCTGKLKTMYENQLATLQEIEECDEEMEKKKDKVASYTKSFLRPAKDTDVCQNLTISIGPKYQLPESWMEGKVRRFKRRHVSDDSDDDSEAEGEGAKKTSEASYGDEDVDTSTLDIEIGALYPSGVLYDHRGPFFKQTHACLVQHDIRDIDNNLIAPWQVYDKLRTGTVVLAQVTMVCWVIKEKDGSFKKVYQLNAHSMRVIAESGEDAECPAIPTLAKRDAAASSKSVNNTPSRSSSSSQAFANFESPSKKRRV